MVKVDMRNFKKNPITEAELQQCRWYAVSNDLIGGYSVATADKPESQLNPQNGEFEIGSFMTLKSAQHIADLHNSWWDACVWGSYYDNIMVGIGLDISNYYDGEQAPLPEGIKPLTEDDWFDYDDEYEAT
jgi:hypothetical protein